MNTKEAIIQKLGLKEHIEGGYYRELYRSDTMHGQRNLMTVIHYMVTSEFPITEWHMNKSDICHFHHQGGRLHYLVLDPAARTLEHHILSSNILEGESSYLLVKGNTWKVCFLEDGEYALISESVAPGFDFKDVEIISPAKLLEQYPQHSKSIILVEKKRVKKE